jgi:hypothetical protein
MRTTEHTAQDGRRIVVMTGRGYTPTVSEYDGARHARMWRCRSVVAARALADRVAADRDCEQR